MSTGTQLQWHSIATSLPFWKKVTINDIECKEKCRLGKISESQMGFEPTTLRDLVACSTTELLETLWWARVNLWVSTGTASRGYTAKYWLAHLKLTNSIRLDHGGSWVQIPSGTRIFFRVYISPYIQYHCCCFKVTIISIIPLMTRPHGKTTKRRPYRHNSQNKQWKYCSTRDYKPLLGNQPALLPIRRRKRLPLVK